MPQLQTDNSKRLITIVLIVVVVVASSGIIAEITASKPTTQPLPERSEYDPSKLTADRLTASGSISPPMQGEFTVLIDASHNNRFQKEDIVPLIRGITEAGGTIKYLHPSDDFSEQLQSADAFVVIDPAVQYTDQEVAEVEQFVNNGGRLLLLGEPNRRALTASGFLVTLSTIRSRMDPLASTFGISFGTNYLYNLVNKDGNYQNILATEGQNAAQAGFTAGGTTVFYTATKVTAHNGIIIRRSMAQTQISSLGTMGKFPVAVISENGQVLAVGDSTFISSSRYNVANNEGFIERIVVFLAGGK